MGVCNMLRLEPDLAEEEPLQGKTVHISLLSQTELLIYVNKLIGY